MAIFPQIKNDPVVQLCDCVRIDASKTVLAKPDTLNTIDKVEISPDGINFVTIKEVGLTLYVKDWYLDWCYDSKTIDANEDYSDDTAAAQSLLTGVLDRSTQSYKPLIDKKIVSYSTHCKIGTGTPAGQLVVDIFDGLPSSPGALLLTSDPIDFSALPASNTELTKFSFATPIDSVATQDYHFALRILSTDGLGTIQIYYPATDTYSGGQRWVSSDGGVSYTAQVNDLSFVVTATVEAIDGVVNPAVRITAMDGRIITKSGTLKLVTETEDCLFSNDQDLLTHEPDLIEWLPEGRTSYIYIHRRAKERILSWLDERGWRDCYDNKFTIDDIFDKDEFKEWSRFLTLKLIFNFIYNARGDVYKDKYFEYCNKAKASSNRAFKLDVSGDGTYNKVQDDVRLDNCIMRRG